MKVLIIDDDPDVLRIASWALEYAGGFTVLVESDPMIGVERASRELPDGIVLDVRLGDTSGPQILERIRAIPELAHTPVIFFTASADAAERRDLVSLDVRGLVEKPFDPFTLPKMLREFFGQEEGAR